MKKTRKEERMYMRRVCFFVLFVLFAISGSAQQVQKKKWVAPKRPKLPKWEVPKQESPEVIPIWRPYEVKDNWFVEARLGSSNSFAENMSGHVFGGFHPILDAAIGRYFSNVWSTRLNFGYRSQNGWADDDAVKASEGKEGEYNYEMVLVSADEVMSLTNLFCPYNEKRVLNVQVFAGVGVNYSFGFSKKTKLWQEYAVDATDHVNLNLRTGVQLDFMVSKAVDVSLQGAFNMVGDTYNGYKRSKSFAFDPYLDLSAGVVIHLPDHYGDNRIVRVRKSEANQLRIHDSRIGDYLDNTKRRLYLEREAKETVQYGKLMNTRISFYVDRAYVNDDQEENLRIVADFLKKNPNVNIIIKGYSGASKKSESSDMHLAQKRVEAVKKSLLRYYDVDESRLSIWFDETADAPYPMEGEWIDAVVFEMGD